ncbi:MAG: hypothetical protein HKP61_12200 [Dactylosporangium sp.]|nr:hypothetical protein [Dactylosporangium sp.]NNJ61683.1 hypothetical protein [Dactylosporangium sp.]
MRSIGIDRSRDAIAGCDPATIRRLQRRLLVVTVKYLPLAIALTLMGCFGTQLLERSIGLDRHIGFAAGWIIGGFGAAIGTLAICVAALWARSAVGAGHAAIRVDQAIRMTTRGRLLILLAAVSAETVTVLDAPSGIDRGLALWVNSIITVGLALFTLIADDVRRIVRRVDVMDQHQGR